MVVEATGTSEGPLSKLAERVTVPATVPTNSIVGDAKTASVLFAGIVNFTTLEPFENCVIGSSIGTSAEDLNESESCPESELERGSESDSLSCMLSRDFKIAGT